MTQTARRLGPLPALEAALARCSGRHPAVSTVMTDSRRDHGACISATSGRPTPRVLTVLRPTAVTLHARRHVGVSRTDLGRRRGLSNEGFCDDRRTAAPLCPEASRSRLTTLSYQGGPLLGSETSTTGYRLACARVSTVDQDPTLQHDALVAAGRQRIFVNRVSGKHESRPTLEDLLERSEHWLSWSATSSENGRGRAWRPHGHGEGPPGGRRCGHRTSCERLGRCRQAVSTMSPPSGGC